MIKVGITGGIGSGKSFVCEVIEKMGYPVYYSDLESKLIMDNDPFIRQELITLLGPLAYLDNKLNRKYLAERLFESDDIRTAVNSIVHPKVRANFDEWCKSQAVDVVFNEAAILFETQSYKQFDAMVLITAPDIVKIQRVEQRDGLSESEIKQRMNKQWNDKVKIPLSDFIILNDGRPILSQVEAMIQSLKK